MKTHLKSIVFFTLLFSFLNVKAQKTFVHPGALHTLEDLERVKEKVLAKETPWIEAWEVLINDPSSGNTYKPNPKTDIGGSGGNRQAAARDFYAAYLNFLRWYVTGDKSHAECAVRICNAWANTVQKAEGELYQIPIAGAVMTAELLRIYPGWKEEDIRKFQSMALDIFYPPCKRFMGSCSHPSWDAQAMASIIAIGIFCDREDVFNDVVEYFKTGKGDGAILNAMDKETGQCFEMGRDQPHAALANASLAQICQLAWNQGVDLFGFADNLLLKGFDYYCKFNLNHPVEWKPFVWCAGGNWFHIGTHPDANRLRSSAVYEMIYNHYMVKKGLDKGKAPYLTALTHLARPELGEGGIYLGHGTLMYTLDASKSPLYPYPAPPAPANLVAYQGIDCIHLKWKAPVGKGDTPTGDVSNGYEVYKSINGGSFSRIVRWNDNSNTVYTDKKIVAGDTYQYYVKAVNQSGAGDASVTATLTAVAPTRDYPAGWEYTDVGVYTVKGNAVYVPAENNTFAITASGAGMGGTADGHGFVFTKVTGDVVLTAKVYESTWVGRSTRIGIVMRETLEGNSKRVTISLGELGARYSRFGVRTTVDGDTHWTEGNNFTYLPIWFRLERSGNTFSAYQSIDGITWHKFATQDVSMSPTCYVGLSSATGSSTEQTAFTKFNNVTVE